MTVFRPKLKRLPGLRCKVLLLWFSVLSVWAVNGQEIDVEQLLDPNPAHIIYGEREGFAQLSIYKVFPDSKGRVWLGTSSGPAQFVDGKVKYLAEEMHYADVNIGTTLQIIEDQKGRIWFAGIRNQLCYYENQQIQPYRWNDTLRKYAPKRKFIEFFAVENDSVYLGYWRHGIHQITPDGRWEKTVFEPLNKDTLDIEILSLGKSLVTGTHFQKPQPGSSIETIRIQLKYLANDDSSKVFYMPHTKAFRKQSGKVHLVAKGDSVFFGFKNTIGLILPTSEQPILKSLDAVVNGLALDASNRLWVAHDDGVHVYQDLLAEPIHHWLKGHWIGLKHPIGDVEGGTWLSSFGKGLVYLPDLRVKFFPNEKRNGFSASSILRDSDKNLLLTSSEQQILKIDSNGSTTVFQFPSKPAQLKQKEILKRSEFRNGYFFLRGSDVLVLNEQLKEIGQLPPVLDLLEFHADSLWMLRHTSIDLVAHGQIIQTLKHPEEFGRIWTIQRLQDGSLLCGTNRGLIRYDGTAWSQYLPSDSLLQDQVGGIGVRKNGSLLFGTSRSGFVMHKDGKSSGIQTKFDLNNKPVKTLSSAIFRISDTDWITQEDMDLIRIQFENMDRDTLRSRLPVTNGMPSFQKLIDVHAEDDQLWIVLPSGILRLDDNVLGNYAPADLPLSFEGLQIQEKAVSFENEYLLQHNQNQLTFHYRGHSFKSKVSLVYRFQLLGQDDQWTATKRSDIRYTNLAPGQYQFHVQVRNQDGQWSKNEINIPITILPPFWATWWFRLLMVLAVGLLVYGLARWQTARVNARNELKNQLLLVQQQALSSQMNPHFIYNAMNSIQRFIMKQEKMEAYKYLEKFGSLIRRMMEQSSQEEISLEEEMDTLKIYLSLEALRFDEAFQYSVSADEALDPEDVQLPPMLIQPYVENAIWHGIVEKGAEGRVSIHFARQGDQLVCTVEDNGVGRAHSSQKKSKVHRSFGMSKTANRLELLSQKRKALYSMYITDLPEGKSGTRVRVTIPIFD